MTTAEVVAALYSALFLCAAIGLVRKRSRAWQAALLALGGLAIALAAPLAANIYVFDDTMRTWWLLGFLPFAYWMPAPLAPTAADERLEAWLLAIDRRLGLDRARAGAALELSYLLVYLLVPVGLAAVLAAGTLAPEDYWLGVLLAVLPCYGLLPLLTTRPPRHLASARPDNRQAAGDYLRTANVGFLAIFGNRWNTLPSGHAAGAVAIAVLVWRAGSPVAPLVALLAAGIAIGTVRGRYHYAVDTLVGVALGLAAGLIPG